MVPLPNASHSPASSEGFLLYLTAFFASMIPIQTPRGDEIFLRMVGSAVDHMLDHSAVG